MSVSLLEHSPFTNYLIPGIILLIANGIMSFVVIVLIVLRTKIYPLIIIAEGSALFNWISIQVIMIRTIAGLHIVLWAVSVLLIFLGVVANKKVCKQS